MGAGKCHWQIKCPDGNPPTAQLLLALGCKVQTGTPRIIERNGLCKRPGWIAMQKVRNSNPLRPGGGGGGEGGRGQQEVRVGSLQREGVSRRDANAKMIHLQPTAKKKPQIDRKYAVGTFLGKIRNVWYKVPGGSRTMGDRGGTCTYPGHPP